jgi:2-C-methyl-D-erythritol 4-phosphate cytidylyltransferase
LSRRNTSVKALLERSKQQGRDIVLVDANRVLGPQF